MTASVALTQTKAYPSTRRAPQTGPYVGPRPFERTEEHLFFGRDREARDLTSLIIANRILVLYSQSGAGKSSLLNTKVSIGLEKEQCFVLPIARVQSNLPVNVTDAEVRNVYAANAILSLRTALPQLRVDNWLTARIVDVIGSVDKSRADRDEPIVWIFDQFEELFSFYEHRWSERAAFVQELVDALEAFSELKIVLSLREDYIAKLDAYSAYFPNKLRGRYHLERLREAAAMEAITGPAERSDRRYDDDVVRSIVQDLLETRGRDLQGNQVTVKGEFVEPVQLQVVCSNLWSSIPSGERLITRRHLEASGSVDEALRKFYDASIADVVRGRKHVSELGLRQWFEKALVTSAGTRGTVFRDVSTTAGMPNQIVDALVDRHLIRGDWRAGAQWYEITHDRLLRPIHESNRLWRERAERRRKLIIGGLAGVGVLIAASAITWSELTKRGLALAANLVDTSSKLPPNNLDLALLLAVEAFQINDSVPTRSNLFSQVLRANRVQHFQRISRSEITGSVIVPGTELVASATANGTLLVWNYRTGDRVYLGPGWNAGGPFNVFADRRYIYAMAPNVDLRVFDVGQLINGRLVDGEKAGNEVANRLVSALIATAAATGPTGDQFDPYLPLQLDPETHRAVALAAGRLLTIRRGELIVIDVLTNSQSRLPMDDRDPPGQLKLIDLSLSPDGKFAFALACLLEGGGASKGRSGPAQRRAASYSETCGQRILKAWRIDDGQELSLPFSVSENSQLIAIGSSDGMIWTAIGGSDGNVTVRCAEALPDRLGKEVFRTVLAAGAPLQDLLFSESSRSLVSTSGSGLAISWQLGPAGRLERRLGEGVPADIAVDRSGAFAAVGEKGYSVLGPDRQKVLLSGAIPVPADLAPNPDLPFIAGVSLAANAKQLLVAQYGVIELWDVDLQRPLGSIDIFPAATASVSMDPRGEYVAAGYVPFTLARGERRSAPAGMDLSRVPIMWTIDKLSPALFVDLTKVDSSKGSSADASSGTVDKPKEPLPAVTVPGVGFSADGRYFIFTQVEKAGSGGSLNVYRRSGSRLAQDAFEPLGVLRMDNSPYLATFSPDSRRLAVSHDNGDVTLFDLDTWQQTDRLRAAGSEAGRLAISPDGKMLAVHHFDDTISLWDLATLAPLGRPIGNLPRALLGLAFSADSRLLITGGQLDTIVGYDLAVESWIAQACDVAHRQLTDEERANYRLPSQGPRACTPQ